MSDLSSLVVRLQADNSQYMKALDQATQKLSKFTKDQEAILDDIAGKFAAAFSIDKIVEFSAGAIESAAAMQRFSQIAGVSVETLSSLSIAAQVAGVDQDGLSQSFKKLNVSISDAAGDPTSKAGIAFKLLGINVKDSNGNVKDAATVTDEVADAFAGAADGANKTALAVALYGRQGQLLIPLLDKGSSGLHTIEQAAKDSGAAMSADAAAAAEELETKLKTLELEVKGGLSSAIANELIPVLDRMTDSFKSGSNRADEFRGVGIALGAVVKTLGSLAHDAALGLQEIPDFLGASVSAATSALKGNLSEASGIVKDWGNESVSRWQTLGHALSEIWNPSDAEKWADETIRDLDKVSAAAQKKKADAPSLAGGELTQKSDDKLKEFSAGLHEQAAAFGLGAEAAARYKLQFGPLADALEHASAAGKAFAASAIKDAGKYQAKVDTKAYTDLSKTLQEQIDTLDKSDVAAFNYKITTGELGDAFNRLGLAGRKLQNDLRAQNAKIVDDKDLKAVHALSDELDTLNGKLVDAAAHGFDLQNKSLVQNLKDRGDTSGQDVVDKAKAATIAQAAYNQELEKAAQIQATFAATAAEIDLERSAGFLNDTQAQQKLNAAQFAELDGLHQILAAESAIADKSGIQALADKTKAFSTELIDLSKNLDQLTGQIRGDLENSLVNPLVDAEMGTKSFKASFHDMITSIERDLFGIADKNIAQSLFGQGGAAGGAPSFLASLFGGNSGAGAGGLASLFGGGGASNVSTAGFNSSLTGLGDSLINTVALDGAFADGGTVGAGKWGLVGENGPELAYAGSRDLQIQPMSSGRGGVHVTVNAKADAPGGTITRRSSMQVANDAARQLSVAARRNG